MKTTKTKMYRALPEKVMHPSSAAYIDKDQFDSLLSKHNMYEAPSLCDGHTGTTVWFCDHDSYRGYVLEIKLSGGGSLFVQSASTFTPTYGIDLIDGNIAQDVEEYVLLDEFGRKTERLDVYGDQQMILMDEYLSNRGIDIFKPDIDTKRKWWKFWGRQ